MEGSEETAVTFPKDEGNGEIKFILETEGRTFTKETTTFTMENKGKRTFAATYWKPTSPTQVRAGVFLCHGFGEYVCSAYEEIAQYLCDHGILVFAHDHIGHGRSSGQRVQADSMNDYVDPIVAHVEAVRKWPIMMDGEESKPLFILGHSMGGLITLFTVFKMEALFKGMILMGPLVIVDPDLATPVKKWLAKVLQGILPGFCLGGIDAALITRDREYVRKCEEDPLMWHGGFRARQSYVLLESCDYAVNNLPNINLPVLILQGSEDKLVLPKGAQMLNDNISSADKVYKVYEGAFHNLYVELPDVKNDAFKMTCDFIEKRC